MSQRLHNLSKWILLEPGRSLPFSTAKRRTVVLDVNCPQSTEFYILQSRQDEDEDPEKAADEAAGRVRSGLAAAHEQTGDDDRIRFLGLAKGRESFEFAVDGAFDLFIEGGGPAYVYSFDGVQTETNVLAPVIFTRMANRRARSPEMEMMAYRMRMNEERRLAALEAEAERRVRAVEKRLEQYLPERSGNQSLGRPSIAARRPAGGPAGGGAELTEAPLEPDEVRSEPAAAGKKRKAAEKAE